MRAPHSRPQPPAVSRINDYATAPASRFTTPDGTEVPARVLLRGQVVQPWQRMPAANGDAAARAELAVEYLHAGVTCMDRYQLLVRGNNMQEVLRRVQLGDRIQVDGALRLETMLHGPAHASGGVLPVVETFEIMSVDSAQRTAAPAMAGSALAPAGRVARRGARSLASPPASLPAQAPIPEQRRSPSPVPVPGAAQAPRLGVGWKQGSPAALPVAQAVAAAPPRATPATDTATTVQLGPEFEYAPAEEKWQYLANHPNAFWDNRVNKRNPKGPDFKLKSKTVNVALWITSKDTPEWARERFSQQSEQEPMYSSSAAAAGRSGAGV